MARTPKVFLINPANESFGYSFITPRWLYVIAQATPQEFGDPIIVDETIKKFDPRIVQTGDIVGIGITTGNCIPGYKALRLAKSRGATVIVGGVHATICPEEPIKMGADAVITGSGDLAWGTALNDKLRGNLQKLYKGGRVSGDLLLSARWDLLDPKKYMFPVVVTVAGCPENCSFCSVWVTDGRKVRQRLTDKIIDEVNELYQMGFRFIIFGDDNFNPSTLGRIEREQNPNIKEELIEIRVKRLEFFREYGKRIPKDMYAFTQMTSEVVSDPEYLKAMHDEMNIRGALVGVESFTEAGLKSANKAWNPVGQKMVEVIQEIQKNGIAVLSSIICGLPTDTIETIAMMRDFSQKSGTLFAQYTRYTPYLGTVDFANMTRDSETLEQITAGVELVNIKRRYASEIVYDKFWLDPDKPMVLIKHPNMDSGTLLRLVGENWDNFYSFQNIIQRAQQQNWPLTGKIWYLLASRAFKALYSGGGVSADSVKKKGPKKISKLSMKLAIWFYNHFFRKTANI